ncbi:MAG: gmuF 2 [Verrucomicrobiaceae bacterium]|nr:gmuF 2 [Verrucomicrobiaceae bacterium]
MSLLHFLPLYQTRVWGGRRLEACLGRSLPDAQPYGESWDLVDRESEQSVVASGPYAGSTLHDLWINERETIFGAAYASHPAGRFPILIKVLDCADDLSIQVHPPVEMAAVLNGEPKTEMWFVAQAEPGAKLYAGLNKGVSRTIFEVSLTDGTVADHVHCLFPCTGDSLFVPSGRLHALGKGLLIYEIQQNSDTTYRVFDWNRVGLDGRPRDLHVQQSMQCIDFNDVEPALLKAGERQVLAACEHFIVSRRHTGDGLQVKTGCFRLILPITITRWGREDLAPGSVALLPAHAVTPGHAEPEGEWLEIEVPV